ncbi:hypothetical protein BGZ99_000054 [Dissophora globulifera]|uniref:Spc7 kinetochore protein domain-containing protein n=1 Tax=Dissophora globulifera TaxID=979702 RepID=A0A9P6RUW7_9FUNG|nr:hypothetical protein BGZ99_000054 [Dissophora globulifera]
MEQDSAQPEPQHQQHQPDHLQEPSVGEAESFTLEAAATDDAPHTTTEQQVFDAESDEVLSPLPKRAFQDDDSLPGDGDSSQPPVTIAALSPPPASPSQEAPAVPGSPSSSSKRRRVSMPGKSILKLTGQDEDGDLTGTHEVQDEPTLGSVAESDATETFSSTSMFERDEKEDELPKTMSFLEGLNPTVASNTPFTFERSPFGGDSNDNNNDGTMDSMTSAGTEEMSQDHSEHTQMSADSSDSEKERSFEVDIYSGNSESGSSGAETPFVLPSSDSDHAKTPFDDGDPDSESSSDDENRHFFPDRKHMKRSSGIGIYEGDRDSVLGPQIDLEQGNESRRLSTQSDIPNDGTQDFSMEYHFHKHRSSIPEPLSAPLLPPSAFDQEVGGKEKRPVVDEDTDMDMDMDITAPIGGIQDLAPELAQEMPPTAFHDVADNTAMFSDLGSMDMTQTVGGILDDNMTDVLLSATEVEPSVSEAPSVPATSVGRTLLSMLFGTKSSSNDDDKNNDTVQKHTENEHDMGTEEFFTSESLRSDQVVAPSTPPRRGSSMRGGGGVGDRSPTSYPRRSLGTPGRLTPNVKARLNIFPEVLEKQLQTLESSTSSEPLFRASHVSPETSSLAKRIYRYSVGAYSRTSGDFQDRLLGLGDSFQDRLRDEQNDTMDMAIDQRLASVQGSSSDIFTESPALTGEFIEATQDEDDPARDANDMEEGAALSESQSRAYSETGDEDSFTELPPISLSKFMSLVGVSFLDHLNASTRRRTIPHRANEADGTAVAYRSSDLVKAMALSVPELHSYREACRLLKQSIDTSRAFAEDQEKKLGKKNPEYFREFRESSTDTKEFMKERFKMIKVHSKLETNAAFSIWRMDVLKVQQEALEQHREELKKDILSLGTIRSAVEREKASVLPRRDDLKRQVSEATERQRSYELCDKEQLASLAEAAEEQGSQIEHYESVKIKKAKELSELRARVEKLKFTEQSETSRIAVAEKTIQEHQYVRMEDLNRAKDVLSIVKATHLWEPLGLDDNSDSASNVASTTRRESAPYLPSNMWTAAAVAATVQAGKPLEFVYDRTIKVSIDVSKVGKETDAVQVVEYDKEDEIDVGSSQEDRQRIMAITALAPKKRKDIKEYIGLLRDYSKMIASKYKAGTTVSKILSDISLFWNKVCLIRRDIELVRAHHVVDLVAGSAENLKELESNSKAVLARSTSATPVVVLDIRVRFTGPILGARRSPRRQGEENGPPNGRQRGNHPNSNRNKDGVPSTEPVKFYLWFTFTLNDLLNFPGPNSFTWRLEVVYGDISHDHITQAVGPVVKKGGYEMLRETCVAVNQLLRI